MVVLPFETERDGLTGRSHERGEIAVGIRVADRLRDGRDPGADRLSPAGYPAQGIIGPSERVIGICGAGEMTDAVCPRVIAEGERLVGIGDLGDPVLGVVRVRAGLAAGIR